MPPHDVVSTLKRRLKDAEEKSYNNDLENQISNMQRKNTDRRETILTGRVVYRTSCVQQLSWIWSLHSSQVRPNSLESPIGRTYEMKNNVLMVSCEERLQLEQEIESAFVTRTSDWKLLSKITLSQKTKTPYVYQTGSKSIKEEISYWNAISAFVSLRKLKSFSNFCVVTNEISSFFWILNKNITPFNKVYLACPKKQIINFYFMYIIY